MKGKYIALYQTALHDDIGQRQINDVFAYQRGVTIFLIQKPDVQSIYKSII